MDSQSVHTRYDDITPYTSKDGSIIRELMHPSTHGNVNQSFAEAEVPVGASTLLHVHMKSEEIYHITAGQGMMSLGGREFQVNSGDTICINPKMEHSITNTGQEPLKFMCASSPPYSHDDTILTGQQSPDS